MDRALKGLSIKVMPLVFVLTALLGNFVSGVKSVEGFDYVTYVPSTESGYCQAHDIPSQIYPTKWNTYIDQVFNTTVRRVTDYANDDPTLGSPPVIQYTTFSCGNSDNSMLRCRSVGYHNTQDSKQPSEV